MPNDNHIIIYKNGYSETENFNYWAYRQGRRLLRFKNKYDYTYYLLSNMPDLITLGMLSPDVMMHIIELYGTNGLYNLLRVVPESEIPESVKIHAARKDTSGVVLLFLQNPSKDVINAALETAGQNLIHLHNPTKEQILLGLSHETDSPWLIGKIKKPTVQMQIAAVTHDFDAVDHIQNPCEAVKIAAANAHGVEILRKIKNPSEQVLLAAIYHTFDDTKELFTHYIPHPNHKISCAINEQINMVKKTLMKKDEVKHNQKHLPMDSWPTEDKLSSKEKEIRQEINNILTTNYFAPTTR